ncbi:MAG: class I SAM-dependent methyltransferase [Gemmatimonadota bacterium]
MSRLHLIEFEDQIWFPRLLRDFMTEWLDFMNGLNRGWDVFAPRIATLLRASRSERIVDLGSGGGGPVLRMRRVVADTQGIDPLLLLTDKYPNRDAFERAAADPSGRVAYCSEPVDATDVPVGLRGVRTMFCSFHHFRPEMARRILADARDKGRAIGIFEGTARSVSSILVSATAPFAVLVTTPFIRPFRWGRLVFTYLIPILPLLCLWDGLVSCLRTYSASELRELVRDLESKGYAWDVGEHRFPGTPVTVAYLIGAIRADQVEASW